MMERAEAFKRAFPKTVKAHSHKPTFKRTLSSISGNNLVACVMRDLEEHSPTHTRTATRLQAHRASLRTNCKQSSALRFTPSAYFQKC
jgi:hypothetical protein